MSEQIPDVDLAFDPEARRKAQAWQEYIESRPANQIQANAVNEHWENRDATTIAYEDMGMMELARILGQAEVDNDVTKSDDVLDVLLEKIDQQVAIAQSRHNDLESGDLYSAWLDRAMKIKDAYKDTITDSVYKKSEPEEAASTEEAKPVEVKLFDQDAPENIPDPTDHPVEEEVEEETPMATDEEDTSNDEVKSRVVRLRKREARELDNDPEVNKRRLQRLRKDIAQAVFEGDDQRVEELKAAGGTFIDTMAKIHSPDDPALFRRDFDKSVSKRVERLRILAETPRPIENEEDLKKEESKVEMSLLDVQDLLISRLIKDVAERDQESIDMLWGAAYKIINKHAVERSLLDPRDPDEWYKQFNAQTMHRLNEILDSRQRREIEMIDKTTGDGSQAPSLDGNTKILDAINGFDEWVWGKDPEIRKRLRRWTAAGLGSAALGAFGVVTGSVALGPVAVPVAALGAGAAIVGGKRSINRYNEHHIVPPTAMTYGRDKSAKHGKLQERFGRSKFVRVGFNYDAKGGRNKR